MLEVRNMWEKRRQERTTTPTLDPLETETSQANADIVLPRSPSPQAGSSGLQQSLSVHSRAMSSSESDGSAVNKDSSEDSEYLPSLLMLPDTEHEPLSQLLEGRRVVNISHLVTEIAKIASHGNKCTTGKYEFQKEYRSGLMCHLMYKCLMCGSTTTITTEEKNKENEMNDSLVWGMISIGAGHSQAKELMSILEVPIMTLKKWQVHEQRIEKVWEAQLDKYMKANGKRELEKFRERFPNYTGTPFITVIVDGGWSKRSYGHAYNASSGVAVIIGAETNGLLYIGVCNKYCYICATTKPNETTKKHRCYKNYTGSSTAMEATIIVQGFRRSEEMHGLQYTSVVGDGDSSVYNRIRTSVPYGKNVSKLECANHMVRGYTDKLHRVNGNTSHPLSARKELALVIPRLTMAARSAIASVEKEGGDVVLLRQDLSNGPSHVFGDHANCRTTYCTRKYLVEENKVPFLKKSSVWEEIKKSLDPLISKADRLTRNVTTNQAERFMGLVAKFTGGKRQDYTKRGGYQRRCLAAGLSHVKSSSWHISPLKRLFGHSPGRICKSTFTVRQKTVQTRRERLQARRGLTFPQERRQRKRAAAAGPDADYGPSAAEPDMSDQQMTRGREEVLARLTADAASEEAILDLERTVGQYGNPMWREARRDRLTASMFGPVICRRPYTPCQTQVLNFVNPRDLNSQAIVYGRIHEPDAIRIYEEKRGVEVNPCGLFIDRDYPYLGASPDGLVGEDRIIEVKCLPSINNLLDSDNKTVTSIREAANVKDLCVTLNKEGDIEIKQRHRYYFQVQGQLNITRRPHCDVILYTDHDCEIFTIDRDESFWKETMLPKLQEFYLECILPEIVDPRQPRNMRVRDSKSILDAQRRKAELDGAKAAKKLVRK